MLELDPQLPCSLKQSVERIQQMSIKQLEGLEIETKMLNKVIKKIMSATHRRRNNEHEKGVVPTLIDTYTV